MRRLPARTILTAACLCLLPYSCTVKEDRGPCPCHLNIFLEDCAGYTDKLSVSGWNTGGGRMFLDRIKLSDYPESYTKKVEKGYMHVSAYGGSQTMTLQGDCLMIPEGKPCDRVWIFAGEQIDATGESAEEHVRLHKQFADLHIRMEELPLLSEDVDVLVEGGTDGISILSLTPHQGRFSCIAPLEDEQGWVVPVPRQRDPSLTLGLYFGGVLRKTIPVGELIENSGYSWEKEDLEDIFISVSLFSGASVSISVNGWDTEKVSYRI